jgi:hypothetical protein
LGEPPDLTLQPIQVYSLILEIFLLRQLKQNLEAISLEGSALMLKEEDVRLARVME